MKRGAGPLLIGCITGLTLLTVARQGQGQITLFSGRQHVSTAWEVCVQAHHAVQAAEVLFLAFEQDADGTLFIDGQVATTFTGQHYVTYSGSLGPGTHLVKL